MKEVKGWEAEDGAFFSTFEEGLEHERQLEREALIEVTRVELDKVLHIEIGRGTCDLDLLSEIITRRAVEITKILQQVVAQELNQDTSNSE